MGDQQQKGDDEAQKIKDANPQEDMEEMPFKTMKIDDGRKSDRTQMGDDSRIEEEEKKTSFPPLQLYYWLRMLFTKYDNSFLIVHGLVFFCQGFKIFLDLSVKDLFKQYLRLEPNQTQFLTSLISLPWCFKIFYGLIADNFEILGSRRKSYIIINGAMQVAALWLLIFIDIKDEFLVTFLLMVTSLNSSFQNVVCNALMVNQARRDLDHGSSDLQVWAWSLLAIGGIIGAILSAFFTQYLQPYDTFFMYSAFSGCIIIAAFFLNPELESGGSQREGGFIAQSKQNLKEIKEAISMPQIHRPLLFFFLSGCIVPSFLDIGYYFSLNVIHFSKFTLSMLTVLGFMTLLLGTIIYNKFFRDYEVRKLLEWNILISFFGCFFGVLFSLRVNVTLGINDLVFVIMTTVVTDTLSLAFSQLPSLVLFAKITPKHIEATVFAFFTGIFNLSSLVISPNIGVLINKYFVGVSTRNLENYYKLQIIQLCLSIVPLFLLFLIPLKKEIHEIQEKEKGSE